MQSEPTIAFRNVEHSPAIEALINQRIEALERFSDSIVGCDVIVEAPQKRKANARGFSVRVNVRVPGPDISVIRHVRQGSAETDLKLAMNRAFSAAEKKLKDHKRTLPAQDIKPHPQVSHGQIVRLLPPDGFGFLKSDDGREVYFQRESFTKGDWDSLQVGTRLRFREMEGDKGPYAANVSLAE